jgi:predicted Zn-dependent protease
MTTAVDAGRRRLLARACRHCAGFAALGLAGHAVAQTEAAALPARFARPAVDTDEGGLWATMDREETRMRRSSFVLRDPALATYVQQLACRLGGDHCADIRTYVVRAPHFNASMAPNGMMQVWTGLLLRVENEAQLAAVMGHEIGHYLERHSLELLRTAKDRTAAGQFLGVFGLVGAIANLAVVASIFSFSREHESRADAVGMRLMRDAGYDGREAARVWGNLIDELKVRGGQDAGTRSVMFATHPPAADRRDRLLELAGDGGGGRTGVDEWQRVIAPHRAALLQDEVRRGQYEESLVLFERLLARQPADPLLLAARGEVYRLRDAEGDAELALADLRQASATTTPPAEAYRSLGLALRRRADAPAAADAFRRYLAAAPEAPDTSLIKHYLSELAP